ncbi:folylpolyglutamate synthase/dihydrofolate synthase family protein [Fictibacillus enclensis]|uniref:bifunctional folylpolyglutamate synthase/dihydrofolate synthase n=1 Tax=Fictibacillus enclensis TaxID=1017270 RepID=UPI0025A1D43B|nr:folylpolyglutamate synthase/dihydrofolate synthase family protein [Fictibacillus enclensis]MDM5199958.1 folylpolyglutamate synthase/dihydrofolate synthase family protein [Fictibacillus enclensis]
MFTSYKDINEYLQLKNAGEMKMGLERMRSVLQKLDHPERKLTCIHVAGTNGKGSTIQMMASILREQGYRVGTFTSPFLVNVREHVQINGTMITDRELKEILDQMKPLISELERGGLGSLSEFEAVTAVAFMYFHKCSTDLCLIETGLGGTTDATNVITPILSVITSIGYDHMNLLGSTLSEIASHKAGIIKTRVPVITAVGQAEAAAVIKRRATQCSSPCFQLGHEFRVHSERSGGGKEVFSFSSFYSKRREVKIGMAGEHQVRNAGLALMAVDLLKHEMNWVIDEDSVISGIKKARWPGRFEVLEGLPTIILDGAHNPEGICALGNTLKRHFGVRSVHVLFAALKDKDTGEMLKPLEKISSSITFTGFEHPRADRGKALFEKSAMVKKTYTENWQEALKHLLQSTKEEEVLLITGSLYFIGKVKAFFNSR